MTRVPKAKGRRDIRSGGAGSGCESPTSGAEFPLRDGLFSVGGDCCPYKPHVGAFVGEDVSDMFDIAYRDMSDTVPVAHLTFMPAGRL